MWLPSEKNEFRTCPVAVLPGGKHCARVTCINAHISTPLCTFVPVCIVVPLVSHALLFAVDLENVSQVVSGVESDPSFSKFKVDSKIATSFFRRGSSTAPAASTYNMAGFLHKKGGSKGGRRNWTYVRDAGPRGDGTSCCCARLPLWCSAFV
jgi:hypothetical protein